MLGFSPQRAGVLADGQSVRELREHLTGLLGAEAVAGSASTSLSLQGRRLPCGAARGVPPTASAALRNTCHQPALRPLLKTSLHLSFSATRPRSLYPQRTKAQSETVVLPSANLPARIRIRFPSDLKWI